MMKNVTYMIEGMIPKYKYILIKTGEERPFYEIKK